MWSTYHSTMFIYSLVLTFPILLYSLDHTQENTLYREKAKAMFQHAYKGYMENAYPADELKPLSCEGRSQWGNISLTLVDALDSLVVFGMYDEFQASVGRVIQNVNFDIDKNVSVFETNIRMVGGLLSAHLLMSRGQMEVPAGWPCNGPLLDLAVDIASRLLPAFATPTGLPYGAINLRHGVPRDETTVTGTASCGTYLLEFGMLSRLTGDPTYEHVARRALKALYSARSKLDLVGNHIDILRAEWIYKEAGIGGNVDSYYEYLLKAGLFFQDLELIEQFKVLYKSIVKHLQHEFWYIWANMFTGMPSLPSVSTLDAFWPSLQVLIGDISQAGKSLSNFYSLISHYGFTPEMFSLLKGQASPGSELYPLRPEFVESLVYMYQATGDQMWRNMGKQVLDSIEISAKTRCGYATIHNVVTHQLEDKMESFFLSETTKYLYLLFSDNHWVFDKGVSGNISIKQDTGMYKVCSPDSFGYTFTTEAHPLASGAIDCCFPRQDLKETALDKLFERYLTKRKGLKSHNLFEDNVKPLSPVRKYYPPLPSWTGSMSSKDKTFNLQYSLYYYSYYFLINIAKSHVFSLEVDRILHETNDLAISHSCNARPWYAQFEVFGAEFEKVVGKKAFRIINNKD